MLGLLPTLLVVVHVGTLVACYVLLLVFGEEDVISYISAASAFEPASYVFSYGQTMSGTLLCVVVYMRYYQIEQRLLYMQNTELDDWGNKTHPVCRLNRLSLAFGVLSGITLGGVGCVPWSGNTETIHMVFAGTSAISMILHVLSMLFVLKAAKVRYMYKFRVACAVFAAVMAMLGTITYKEGWNYFSSVAEYLGDASLVLFFISYHNEFMKWNWTVDEGPEEELYDAIDNTRLTYIRTLSDSDW